MRQVAGRTGFYSSPESRIDRRGLTWQLRHVQVLDQSAVHEVLEFPSFIDSLEKAFGGKFTMPARRVMELSDVDTNHDAFALLPAWNDEVIAVKAFTYFPGNEAPDLSVYAKIMLFKRGNGEPIALVDGTTVTYYRTAGVSALASRLLSRENSKNLLICGTGNLVPYLVDAHASVRDLKKVIIWGRSLEKAKALVDQLSLKHQAIEFQAAEAIQSACKEADVIVCATNSPDPLVLGQWVKAGTHCDFLGNHHVNKRECDEELVLKSKLYVDTFENCLKEAGEILIPIRDGKMTSDDLVGELAGLCGGMAARRESEEEITLFKSVGCALGDLCGARVVYEGTR